MNPDTVVLEITVTRDTASELKAMADHYMWEFNDGLRMILGAGMGALTAERVGEPATDQERIVRLSRMLVQAEGRLAGVRYDRSEARRALKNWEMSNGAIRELTVGLEQVIKRQNQELEDLKQRLEQRNAEIDALRERLGMESDIGATSPALEPAAAPAKTRWRLRRQPEG